MGQLELVIEPSAKFDNISLAFVVNLVYFKQGIINPSSMANRRHPQDFVDFAISLYLY